MTYITIQLILKIVVGWVERSVREVYPQEQPNKTSENGTPCITHPVSEAIARYAEAEAVQIYPRGEWDYQVGLGIRAKIDSRDVLVGSGKFLAQQRVDLECFYEEHPCFLENSENPNQESLVS